MVTAAVSPADTPGDLFRMLSQFVETRLGKAGDNMGARAKLDWIGDNPQSTGSETRENAAM